MRGANGKPLNRAKFSFALTTVWTALVMAGGIALASPDPSPAPAAAPIPSPSLSPDAVATPAAGDTSAPTLQALEKQNIMGVPSPARNWVLTGFFSKHFSEDRLENDYNSGAFFEHDFNRNWGFLVGQYKNSGDIQSRILTGTWQPLHYGPVSFGLVVGLLDGYVQLNHGHLSPGLLPFMSVGTRGVKANIFCVPPVLKTAPAVCSIQFGVNLGDSRLGL